jgi:hypothetical protein
MRRDETLREYTNHYFENRDTLAGVKDEDVITYYKKGITNIMLFEKIHEADTHTIADLMAYVNKLVDTQGAVMHDFNREDHDDGGNRSCKRSGKAYKADPPRPSTFLEGDFNMVMDDQCQFHREAKHNMRECEQLKRSLGVPFDSKKTKSNNNDDRNGASASTTVTVDLIDVITVIAGPIIAATIGIDVIITATTDMATTVAKTMTTGVKTARVITVMTSVMTGETIDAMIDVAKTTTTATNNNRKEQSPPPPPKGGNPNGAFQSANREINFIVGGRQVTKSNRQIRSNTREIGHVNIETPQPLRWSEFPITFSRKDRWVHIADPGTYPLVIDPGTYSPPLLHKTLIDGGNDLNIIFTETLRKMDFDFNKMTACDEPFYGVVPRKAAYPIGRVCLPVTFGTKENFRTKYLTFEVADFLSSYHAILGRPMLAKFMTIPHHTYLIMKMPAPNGILSVLRDIMVSYNCESTTVELCKDSAIKAVATVMVAQAAKID